MRVAVHEVRTVVTGAAVIIASAWLSASQPIASRWRDKDIAVDGTISEWTELTSFDEGISVAAFNDGRDLYLAVASSDAQRRRQLATAGLVVWLDPGGGKKEVFGVRIPGAAMSLPAITYIELWGPGKNDKRRIELSADTGIKIGTALDQGTLAYELKIPLSSPASAQPYGIQASADHPIGLGLRTPKLERLSTGGRDGGMGGMGGRRGGGGMAGGRRGGVGGRTGGGGGRTGAGGGAQVKDLKLWTILTLARETR
ncbi:MAG: hypothetical protein ABIS06_20250 [Vicinamibacterales bacterium]